MNLIGSSFIRKIRSFIKPSRLKVLVINDTRDQNNWGSQGLVDALSDILLTSLPRASFSYVPSHSLFDPAMGYPAPEMLLPHLADQFEVVAEEWLAGHGGPGAAEYLAQVKHVQAVVLNGEGSVYRNNYSAIKGLFLLWFAKTQFGLPTLFLNGGVHLTRVQPILPAIVRKTFGAIDGVAVREPYSLRCLKEFAPEVHAHVIPDSVFYFARQWSEAENPPSRLDTGMSGPGYFCLSGGQMPYDHRFGQRSALIQLIAELKKIVPQAVLMAKEPDDQYLAKVAEDTGSLFFGPEHSYAELMALLAGAKFHLGSRYHHLIMATIVGCPSIAFAAMSHKNHGLCELLEGAIGTPYDGTDLRSQRDAIMAQAAHYVADAEPIRAGLRDLARQRATETLELGRMVYDCLEPA